MNTPIDQTAQDKPKGTLEDFQRLAKELPRIRCDIQDFPALVRSSPKLSRLIQSPDFYWADIYDLPFNDQIGLLVCALGYADKLHQVATSDNPTAQAISWLDADDSSESWLGGTGGIFKEEHVIGLTVVIQRNILSIMMFQRSIATLLEEARSGNLSSLFNAIRVDRSIVACPSVAARIAKAELEQDEEFFDGLKKALNGPSKKYWASYQDLRYAMCLLRDMGFDNLPDDLLEALLVSTLELYPNTPGARKNIRKQFTQSKKISTTSK